MKRKSVALLVISAFLTVGAWAHGGMTHVIGVVKGITATAITVETRDHKTVECNISFQPARGHGLNLRWLHRWSSGAAGPSSCEAGNRS